MEKIVFSKLYIEAIKKAFIKFDPRIMIKNPTMFICEIALVLNIIYQIINISNDQNWLINSIITFWIFTIIFLGNYAESLAELRGKQKIKKIQLDGKNITARLITSKGEKNVNIHSLKIGDEIICSAGEIIPVDGEIFEGIATIDESAITGESAPVIRESESDLKYVKGGTKILSDTIKIKVTKETGTNYIEQMSSIVEHSKRHRSTHEVMITTFLSSITVLYIFLTISLKLLDPFLSKITNQNISEIITIPIYLAFFVSIIPCTLAGILSSIGLSAIGQLLKKNVVLFSLSALEVAGDIDIFLVDKTGTITIGNRRAYRFHPSFDIDPEEFAKIAQLASLSDNTTEGKSINAMTKSIYGIRSKLEISQDTKLHPFSSFTKMSGIDIKKDGKYVEIRKGSIDAMEKYLKNNGSMIPEIVKKEANKIARLGDTPLIVTYDKQVKGIVQLKDIVKGTIKRRLAPLKRMGIKTLMVTGDNIFTSTTIAAEAGVDDFLSEVTPEDKLTFLKNKQEEGYLVAMAGDGTNDAPALAQADLGLCMKSGTTTAWEASNMIDLDNNPAKLVDIVRIGKQILITRGTLTIFNLASDVAKFIAMVPIMYSILFQNDSLKGPLEKFNFLQLSSAQSSIISGLIFNGLLFFILIPMASKGVMKETENAISLIWKNLFIYGVGGFTFTLLSIKIIDLIISLLGI